MMKDKWMYFRKYLYKRLFMLHGRPFFILKVVKFIYIKYYLNHCFSCKEFIECTQTSLNASRFNLYFLYTGHWVLTFGLLLVSCEGEPLTSPWDWNPNSPLSCIFQENF